MIWALVAIAVIIGVWLHFYLRAKRNEPDPVALVLLLETPRMLDLEHVKNALAAIRPEVSAGAIREERQGYYRLWADGYELTIASAPIPYLQAAQIEQIREARMKEVAQIHTGCILIDCWNAPTGHDRSDALPVMGRLVAELCDETTLAIYSTVSQRLNMINDETVEQLRSGEASEATESANFDPIIYISGDDERMQAAVEEARTRWPEFVQAWTQADDRSMFLAKFPFAEGEEQEFMWVNPTSIDDSAVTGTLMSSPFRLRRVKEGQEVTVPLTELSDWLYVSNDQPVGGFTDEVLRSS